LYIHTKGVVPQASPGVANWREILNYYMIDRWPQNVALLEHNQVVAINDQHTEPHAIVSGNFFWARSDYIRTLQDPLQEYVGKENFHRYSFEAWILSMNPRVHYTINTQVNHYGTYCFLEDLIHKQ
jgi:hypothetical protein